MSSPDSLLELIRREIRRELAHAGGALVMGAGGDGGDQAGGTGNSDGGDFGGSSSGDGGDFSGSADVGGGGDSMTPTYLKINPDGTIGADFTGHVHAQGLDLDAGTSVAPSPDQRVRWLRTSDGALVADLAGYALAAGQGLRQRAYGLTAADVVEAVVDVLDDLGTEQAYITVTQTGRGASAQVRAFAGGVTQVVADKTGVSGFLQSSGTKLSAVGTNTVHFPGASQFSNTKNVKLTGATGSVFMLANAENSLGTGVVILATPDAAGGSNVQAWSSVAPAASDVTFQYLQWGT